MISRSHIVSKKWMESTSFRVFFRLTTNLLVDKLGKMQKCQNPFTRIINQLEIALKVDLKCQAKKKLTR
jgi:hypothetical protein